MRKPILVVMAAGMGSRYGGLKQIDPVGPSGEIIIDYSIHDAIEAGFEKVVFIIRPEIEDAFREKVGDSLDGRIETAYAFQTLDALPAGMTCPPARQKPWGTGHAVFCAKDLIDAPFAVINADDFYGRAAFSKLYNYLEAAADTDTYDYCMVGYVLNNTLTDHGHVSRGVCRVDAEGRLAGIDERTKIQRFGAEVKYTDDEGATWTAIDPQSIASMNMFGYTPSILDELESRFVAFLEEKGQEPKSEFFIPLVTSDLIAEGKAAVHILPTDAHWLGVTYQEDTPVVQKAILELVAAGAYPECLWGK